MKIADFFVQIGIKGNTQVKNSLTEVRSSLGEAAQSSMALKTGIFGAVLALEEITRRSVGAAVDLKNFAGATGLSTQELQRWGYWAEVNDVKAEEMAGTIRGLQSAQSALRLGQGVPAGAVYFGLNQNNNPIEMMGEIQKKLRAIGNDQKEIGNARTMAATLGISDTMFAGLRIGTVGFAGLTKEMVLTGKEQEKLLALNREWNMFWMNLKGTAQKTVANDLSAPIASFVHMLRNSVKEASELIHSLNQVLDSKDFDKLKSSNAMKALGAAAAVALASVAPFSAALAAIVVSLDQIYKYTHGQDSWLGGILKHADQRPIGPMTPEQEASRKVQERDQYRDNFLKLFSFGLYKGDTTSKGGNENNVTNNNTFNIDGAKNPKEIQDQILEAITTGYFQNSSVNSISGAK